MRKKMIQRKKELSQLNETSNDFVIGNGNCVSIMKNEASEQQSNGHYIDFERVVDTAIKTRS